MTTIEAAVLLLVVFLFLFYAVFFIAKFYSRKRHSLWLIQLAIDRETDRKRQIEDRAFQEEVLKKSHCRYVHGENGKMGYFKVETDSENDDHATV